MELLIALGLGIYLIVVCSTEKAHKKKSDIEHKTRFEELSLEHDMFYNTYAASEEMEKSAREKVVINDKDTQDIRERIISETSLNPTHDMIIRALLAQHGKISRRAAYGGFGTNIYGRMSLEEEREFLVWYDNELRKHGVPYRLMFTSWNDQAKLQAGDLSVAKWVSECGSTVSGVYFWIPIRGFLIDGDDIIVTRAK